MAARAIEFLDAKRREDATRIWHAALRLEPLPSEPVPLADALGRVLGCDIVAPIDVPPFDRSIVDGYALIAADTFAASETTPVRLRLLPETILAGVEPHLTVVAGSAVEIATGGILPRGANATQMVERTDRDGSAGVLIYKPVVPGALVQAAGSDLRAGDIVLRRGVEVTSRESGVLAALGIATVECVRRPRVAVFSTGDELVAPGASLRPGLIYDANSRVIADALRENGAEPEFLGIVPDIEAELRRALEAARGHDAVVLSGGTSKGSGDLSYRLLGEIGRPGVLVHGVQVKPGKPVVLAAWEGRPVAVLPGFPTSAILTFNLFVRPVIRILAGLNAEEPQAEVMARVAHRVHSAPGRYEYLLVNLVRGRDGSLRAYPVPKGSGSISAFSDADGYLEVPEARDLLLEGEEAKVTLLNRRTRPADLVLIGSQCQGMDLLIDRLRRRAGVAVKALGVGSSGGVAAILRGEADVAGIHLLAADGTYNHEAWREVSAASLLIRGYRRRQGILYRRDDFARAPTLAELALDRSLRLINRPRGSGTRILFDLLLGEIAAGRGDDPDALGRSIPGHDLDARSHTAAAAAIAARRADWGVAIEAAARRYDLGFVPLRAEDYDLLVQRDRFEAAAVQALLAELRSADYQAALVALGGFEADGSTGSVVAGHPA